MIGLYLVVVFGSSLDIAAIEAGCGEQLDYNQELQTVGYANILSGAVGGTFTGSYIFSQTLFSMNSKVDTDRDNDTDIVVSVILKLN